MDPRRVIACVSIVVVVLATFVPRALGQQPPGPTAPAVSPPAPAAPAAVVVEVSPTEPPLPPGRDIYDVGAAVLTVARVPFNVALCGLGAVTGTALFLLTLGSAYRASTRAIEEGCAQPWVIRGDDLRPRGAAGIFPTRPSGSERR